MNDDIDQLTKQRDELDRQITEAKRERKLQILTQLRATMAEHGIVSADLDQTNSKRKGQKMLPKYSDPVSGKTWSGQGREPAWIKDRDRDQFRIKE